MVDVSPVGEEHVRAYERLSDLQDRVKRAPTEEERKGLQFQLDQLAARVKQMDVLFGSL